MTRINHDDDKDHHVVMTVFALLSATDSLCQMAQDDETRAYIQGEADNLAAVVLSIGSLLAAVQVK